MSRYPALFERLNTAGEGAFVPFVMLGDPTPQDSIDIIEALIKGGADALELGVPFSDPVADGPTIQAAHIRALDAHVTVDDALHIVATIRELHPNIPMGLLIYGNVPFSRGLDTFYRDVAKAGADSVLIPDIPVREGKDFITAADEAGIDQIFIAPPHASEATLQGVAANSRGYIYAVSRVGVTGAEHASSTDGLADVVTNLNRFGGAPALLGFGISEPDHVAAAITSGAAGAISGSAVTKIIETHCEGAHPNARTLRDKDAMLNKLTDFVRSMKQATTR